MTKIFSGALKFILFTVLVGVFLASHHVAVALLSVNRTIKAADFPEVDSTIIYWTNHS